MWRAVTLCMAIAAAPIRAGDALDALPMDLLTTLANLRPANEVVRHVKAKAPELFVDLKQILGAWGYPLETHSVTTEDGYVLRLHRIPRGRGDAEGPAKRSPVLLQHGLLGCSEQWVLGGPGIAPALTLADNGYDVWMGNIRGNHYSRKHRLLSPASKRFWMFSWHEVGVFDVPAMIDYVLQASRRQALFYMGHSMGNLMLYIAASARPDISAKVRLQLAFAQGALVQHMPSITVRSLAANWEYLKSAMSLLPTYEIPRSNSLSTLWYITCSDKTLLNKFCGTLYASIVGNTDLNNVTGLDLQLARGFSSTSSLLVFNYGQSFHQALEDRVQSFDYGTAAENLRVYSIAQPPEYDLRRLQAPVALYAAQGDYLSSPKVCHQKQTITLPGTFFK